jgi:hypothetical protein
MRLSLLPLLLLGACARTPIIGNAYYDSAFAPGEQTYGGPVGLAVLGPEAPPAASVIAAMSGAGFGMPTVLAPYPTGSPYRVVLAFAPAAGVSSGRLCAEPPKPDGAAAAWHSGRVPVSAVLCRGDKVMSATDAIIALGQGPDDPVFRAGLAQIALALFPARNPNLDVPPV